MRINFINNWLKHASIDFSLIKIRYLQFFNYVLFRTEKVFRLIIIGIGIEISW